MATFMRQVPSDNRAARLHCGLMDCCDRCMTASAQSPMGTPPQASVGCQLSPRGCGTIARLSAVAEAARHQKAPLGSALRESEGYRCPKSEGGTDQIVQFSARSLASMDVRGSGPSSSSKGRTCTGTRRPKRCKLIYLLRLPDGEGVRICPTCTRSRALPARLGGSTDGARSHHRHDR